MLQIILLLHKWLRQAGVGCEKLALLMTHTLDRCSTPQLQTLQYQIALYMSTCHSFLHKSGCLPKQDALNDAPFAGVLGSMLTDDEAGRVKLTRVAINVGKVPILVSVLLAVSSSNSTSQHFCSNDIWSFSYCMKSFSLCCFGCYLHLNTVCCCDAQHAYAAVLGVLKRFKWQPFMVSATE